ncbi:MAG: hypothetical protein JXL80_07700 [Planctomycetes bacterium]|nr:hypothetical protein [Planctomycetota bacterium]
MIEFRCPHCGEGVEVDDQFAGLKGQCPECGKVIVIPRPNDAPPTDPAAAQSKPDIHGPRRMAVPESVLSIDPLAQVPATETAVTGPSSSITPGLSLLLAVLPCLSVLGLIFGGISWSRASKAGRTRHRRVAIIATVLAAVWTLAQMAGGVALLAAAVQISIATSEEENCCAAMSYVGSDLTSQATSSADGTLPKRMTISGFTFYGDRCPANQRRFGYIGNLVYDSSARTIFLYDPEPAHGYATWLESRPDGRNVYRMDGTAEFLSEEAFQKEMSAQAAKLGHPWDGAGPDDM